MAKRKKKATGPKSTRKRLGGAGLLVMDVESTLYGVCMEKQREQREPNGEYTWWLNVQDAADEVLKRVQDAVSETGCSDALLCLGAQPYYRRMVSGDYKSHREGTKKPLGYSAVVDEVCKTAQSMALPTLEADDVAGIVATAPRDSWVGERLEDMGLGDAFDGGTVLCSVDKDLMQVPGRLYNPHVPEQGVIDIDSVEAEAYFYAQVMAGDASDGYKGVRGVGTTTALRMTQPLNDGSSMWGVVLEAYEKAGQSVTEAVRTARLARVLRFEDYDPSLQGSECVGLWEPPE